MNILCSLTSRLLLIAFVKSRIRNKSKSWKEKKYKREEKSRFLKSKGEEGSEGKRGGKGEEKNIDREADIKRGGRKDPLENK